MQAHHALGRLELQYLCPASHVHVTLPTVTCPCSKSYVQVSYVRAQVEQEWGMSCQKVSKFVNKIVQNRSV
jgi:hypothetical protein